MGRAGLCALRASRRRFPEGGFSREPNGNPKGNPTGTRRGACNTVGYGAQVVAFVVGYRYSREKNRYPVFKFKLNRAQSCAASSSMVLTNPAGLVMSLWFCSGNWRLSGKRSIVGPNEMLLFRQLYRRELKTLTTQFLKVGFFYHLVFFG